MTNCSSSSSSSSNKHSKYRPIGEEEEGYKKAPIKGNSYGTIIAGGEEEDNGEDDGSSSLYPIDLTVKERLVRKLDLRMMLWGFFAYFANNLDRNNLQNAFTMGMDKDLDLKSSAYNWAIAIFSIGYLILQIPGSIIVAKFSPRWILPSCVVAWGTVVCFMTLIQDYKGLWVLRFCLGLMEAPFYPGMIFLFGNFYTKDELGKRVMFLATGNEFSGAFGGFIAGFITDTMHNVGGLPAWKWLFIIEGSIAISLGIIGYFLLPDFPHNTLWLTPEERNLAVLRVQQKNQSNKNPAAIYNWKRAGDVLTATPYIWIMLAIFSCLSLGHYMIANFAIILRDMGFSVSFANYMLTPVNFFAAIFSVCVGWSSDKSGDRALHIAGVSLWVGIWCLILASVNGGNNPAPLVIIGTCGIVVGNSLHALCLAWTGEIYKHDQYARAVAIAFVNSLGNLLGKLATIKTWVVTDSPAFWLGKISSMVASFMAVILTILLWFLLRANFVIPKKSIQNSREYKVIEEEETTIIRNNR
ncbi:major facilitator superfamily domain-containing protein [Phascolomyces articulosus]|uniref:Major facilitator superfamily domain-containing protein n=1 Tax=Phascolomyces articulosus TaxID=60185 RepID=A0AAD5K5E5_9FUNG|nr:major facilitator superfamily domain-containing protein [Phascolomyces articulosus]